MHDFDESLEDLDVSHVKYMRSMFENCVVFNQLLNNWDVSNVRDVRKMFKNCEGFN
jgi:hypothetical protein